MSRAAVLAAGALAAGAAFLAGCGGEPEPLPPPPTDTGPAAAVELLVVFGAELRSVPST